MFKEPLSIATRHFASPSRRTVTLLPVSGSPTKKSRPSSMISQRTYTSKVLLALDAQELDEDEDEDIEILGPFPATSGKGVNKDGEKKGKKVELKVKGHGDRIRIHPLFKGQSSTCSSDKATSTNNKTRKTAVKLNSADMPPNTKENVEPVKISTTATKNKINLPGMQLSKSDCLRSLSERTEGLSRRKNERMGLKELDPDCVPAPHSTTVSRSRKKPSDASFVSILSPAGATTASSSSDHWDHFLDTPNTDSTKVLKQLSRNKLTLKGGKNQKAAKDDAETGEPISCNTIDHDTPVSPAVEAEGDVVADFPMYSYKDYTPTATVVYTRHEDEADDLIESLKKGPVAFDMEWRVIFTRSGARKAMSERRTAVVQIADISGLVLVVQITGMGRFPKKLQELIEDPKVPKVGVNILNDGQKLFRDYGILSQNLVELGALAQIADPETSFGRKRKVVSLAKLVEAYCGKTLDKGDVRTGNWEEELDEVQLEYAVNDVHCAIRVYNTLLKKAEETERDTESKTAQDFYTTNVPDPHENIVFPGVNLLHVQEATEMRPQYLRAYRMWHQQHMSVEQMCIELSLKGKGYGPTSAKEAGLKVGTVITYIVSALQVDPKLPCEKGKVRELLQMDSSSWMRHREWFVNGWKSRGVI